MNIIYHDFLTQVLNKTVKEIHYPFAGTTASCCSCDTLEERNYTSTFKVLNLRLTIYLSPANDAGECRPSTGA